MLKTSSTESAKPKKSVVGFGGDGRNRVEPVGKHEVDGVDNDGGRSGDFDRKCFPRLRQAQPCCADIQVFIGCAQIDVSSCAIHLDAQNELTNRLINQRGPDCG